MLDPMLSLPPSSQMESQPGTTTLEIRTSTSSRASQVVDQSQLHDIKADMTAQDHTSLSSSDPSSSAGQGSDTCSQPQTASSSNTQATQTIDAPQAQCDNATTTDHTHTEDTTEQRQDESETKQDGRPDPRDEVTRGSNSGETGHFDADNQSDEEEQVNEAMPNGVFDLSALPPSEVEYVYVARRDVAARVDYEASWPLDSVKVTTYGIYIYQEDAERRIRAARDADHQLSEESLLDWRECRCICCGQLEFWATDRNDTECKFKVEPVALFGWGREVDKVGEPDTSGEEGQKDKNQADQEVKQLREPEVEQQEKEIKQEPGCHDERKSENQHKQELIQQGAQDCGKPSKHEDKVEDSTQKGEMTVQPTPDVEDHTQQGLPISTYDLSALPPKPVNHVYMARKRHWHVSHDPFENKYMEVSDDVEEFLGIYMSQEDAENRIKAENLAQEYTYYAYEFGWEIVSGNDEPLRLLLDIPGTYVHKLWVVQVELSGMGSQGPVPEFRDCSGGVRGQLV
jgi:hypothetical protein